MTLAGEPCSESGAKEALEAIGLKRLVHRLPSKVLSQGQKPPSGVGPAVAVDSPALAVRRTIHVA